MYPNHGNWLRTIRLVLCCLRRGTEHPSLHRRSWIVKISPPYLCLLWFYHLKNIPLLRMCPGNRPPKNPFEALSKKSFQSLFLPLRINIIGNLIRAIISLLIILPLPHLHPPSQHPNLILHTVALRHITHRSPDDPVVHSHRS